MIRDRLHAAWVSVRRSPARMALVAGTGLAAVITGGLLAVTLSGVRHETGSESSVPPAFEPSATTIGAEATPETTPDATETTPEATASPTGLASPTPSLSPSPAGTSTAEPAPEPDPLPGEPSPTATPGLAIEWETLPAMPAGSDARIADVIELSSGELGVVFWASSNTSPEPEDLVLTYDPVTETWQDVALAGDALRVGTNSEFVVVAGEIVNPAGFEGVGLAVRELSPAPDEWTVTDRGIVDDEFSTASEVTAAVIDGLVYVIENQWSPSRTTGFLVYDPDDGVVGRTSETPGHLYEAFGDGEDLYAGGSDGALARYDPDLDTWEAFAPPPPFGEPRFRHAAATGPGRLWVPAYHDGSVVVWAWSPSTSAWQEVDTPGDELTDVHLLATSDGAMYVITPSLSFRAVTPPAR
jgi:hypothetical protein